MAVDSAVAGILVAMGDSSSGGGSTPGIPTQALDVGASSLSPEIQNIINNGFTDKTDHDSQLLENMAEINQKKRNNIAPTDEELISLRLLITIYASFISFPHNMKLYLYSLPVRKERNRIHARKTRMRKKQALKEAEIVSF